MQTALPFLLLRVLALVGVFYALGHLVNLLGFFLHAFFLHVFDAAQVACVFAAGVWSCGLLMPLG